MVFSLSLKSKIGEKSKIFILCKPWNIRFLSYLIEISVAMNYEFMIILCLEFEQVWNIEIFQNKWKLNLQNAFPHYAESSVRKRLKQCSEFKRLGTGPDQVIYFLT